MYSVVIQCASRGFRVAFGWKAVITLSRIACQPVLNVANGVGGRGHVFKAHLRIIVYVNRYVKGG